LSDRRLSTTGAGGGAGLAGASGGEAIAGGGGSREIAGALEADTSVAAGLIDRKSFSNPLRLPNTTILHVNGLLCPQLL
jgi:hypothetical protein